MPISYDHVPKGLFLCAPAALVVTIDGEVMTSDPSICVLAFDASFDETLHPGVSVLPSRLHLGDFNATVVGPSGVKHSVRAGFVIAEPRP